MTELALSEDGYLLSKRFHSSCLKETIDISKIDFDRKRYIKKEEYLAEIDRPDYERTGHGGRRPTGLAETYHIQELYKYDTPKPTDIVCWYDDIGILSGSAGYVLIRDGYVWNTNTIWRS